MYCILSLQATQVTGLASFGSLAVFGGKAAFRCHIPVMTEGRKSKLRRRSFVDVTTARTRAGAQTHARSHTRTHTHTLKATLAHTLRLALAWKRKGAAKAYRGAFIAAGEWSASCD